MSQTLRAGTVVSLHGRAYRLLFPATVDLIAEADAISSLAAEMGRKGGKVRGETKRRAVDYAELGRRGGRA